MTQADLLPLASFPLSPFFEVIGFNSQLMPHLRTKPDAASEESSVSILLRSVFENIPLEAFKLYRQ